MGRTCGEKDTTECSNEMIEDRSMWTTKDRNAKTKVERCHIKIHVRETIRKWKSTRLNMEKRSMSKKSLGQKIDSQLQCLRRKNDCVVHCFR